MDIDIADISHSRLTFKSPLSAGHAARLVEAVRPLDGAHVLDLGCGRGELLAHLVAAAPDASGVGVDTHAAAIGHARAAAAAWGLAGRVDLTVADAATHTGTGDVVVCLGARHAWTDTRRALEVLRARLRPGGRLLFGEAFWERPPTPGELSGLGADSDELGSLPDLVDLALDTGYRMLDLSVAGGEEWDAFESGWCAGLEHWLLGNPEHPDAPEVRRAVDEHRSGWLRGYRGVLGFAYLVLAVPR